MHASVMEFLREHIHRTDIEGYEVLEVGSMDLNGSPRQVVMPLKPLRYVGVDTGPGHGVDLVCDATNLIENVGEFAWDAVISTEMLEHAKDWRTAVNQMKLAVRRSGILVVTTRGPGFPYHAHPDDYWRFTVNDFERIFTDFEIEVLKEDPGEGFPGVLMKARKTRARRLVDLCMFEVEPVVRPAS